MALWLFEVLKLPTDMNVQCVGDACVCVVVKSLQSPLQWSIATQMSQSASAQTWRGLIGCSPRG